MRFPINLRFKIVALANQIFISDGDGVEIMYVKQKMFKFKENIEIYQDKSKTNLLYTLKADRVIDWSPVLTLTDTSGNNLGNVKRHGRKSIWKANYDITLGDTVFANVREASVWSRVGDAIFGELPFIGIFAGYIFNPKYFVRDTSGQLLATIAKRRALFEGKFEIEADEQLKIPAGSDLPLVAMMMTVVLFERVRG